MWASKKRLDPFFCTVHARRDGCDTQIVARSVSVCRILATVWLAATQPELLLVGGNAWPRPEWPPFPGWRHDKVRLVRGSKFEDYPKLLEATSHLHNFGYIILAY